uniref:Neuron navigator 2 n=1 Tax=Echinococcus granulosus TaxID=6210 RepID=A0A068WM03_ECHGR|nr:neuron navigator 2 [Echinococcus granulosus]
MLSKAASPQDTTKFSTLKKPAKVATVLQQSSYNRQMRGSTVEPPAGQRFSSMTLPTGIVQPQVTALRYPFYRIQSPQMIRQNSVPNSPCCPGGPFPRFVGRTPNPQQNHQQHASMVLPYPTVTIPATTLSCIATPMTQRQARHLAKQTFPADEVPKTPSSSSSSRDSGIMSQDSSTSSQSFTNDEFNNSHQLNGGGFRTPQCVSRRGKHIAKKMVVEAPAVRYRGSGGGTGGTLNRARMAKSVNAGSRVASTTTSTTSSPATPRASWNSSSSTGGENESVKTGNRVGRSTSLCSETLERERKKRNMQGKQDSTSMAVLATTNSGRIPRPTNLAGDRSPRGEKEVMVLAKKVHHILNADEKPTRNSSLPSGSDRQFGTAASPSQISALRAKTLSPPPQFASSKTLLNSPPANSMTSDSSSTSTCTLAANTKESNASLQNRITPGNFSNLDDTPTPSNRGTPEPRATVAAKPRVVVEEFNTLTIPTMPMSPRSPRLSPRLSGAGEDHLEGSLGYGPLSHIKLPYSTPVMQRMHQTTGRSGNVGYSKREKSSLCSGQPISEAFGSHMSLSSSSSVMSPASDSAFEAAKLRRELELAHQKVAALTCQLSANTSVVQAFEQSLQSMNQRLHQLSASSALKTLTPTSSVKLEREVQELRKIIDRFRCQALQNDWPPAMENARNGRKLSQSQEFVKSHHILDSEMLQQAGSLSSLVHGPHAITGGGGGAYGEVGRYLHDSTGRGFMSPSYMPIRDSLDRANKKAGWLRSSISRAFRRSKSRDPPDRTKVTSTSSQDPNQPSPSSGSSVRHSPSSSSGESPSTTGRVDSEEGGESMATDAGGVMEAMQETVRQLQHQVRCLRAENAFLQRAVDRCSLATSESDKASVGSASAPGAFSLVANPLRISRLIRELFAVTPEIGQHAVPVFLRMSYKDIPSRPSDDVQNFRRTTAPSSPSQHYLSLPGQQAQQMGCTSPNISTRLLLEESRTDDLSHLHLLGRVCLNTSASDLLAKVKNLFHTYLHYLDSDGQIGISADSISSICVKMTPQSMNSGQPPREVQISPHSIDNGAMRIDPAYEILRIVITLHENAYALEKPVAPSLLNPLAVSSIAWISLLSAPLLGKMIESLLANKCVVIYGPRGSGKLEFGRILIDSMANMFPGFWTNQPNAVHYYLRASSNAISELRQVLLNALLSVEGLIILRMPPSLLPDLVNIMTELGFNTHPRKILLLAITDTLIFPEEPTKLRNCPGIFPFLADIQSASIYMRRCLRQRFSQFAFQCLDASSVSNAAELDTLTEVIEWLPEFWLRCVTASAWNNLTDDSAYSSAFVLSPFRLLACPLTLQASSVWFREVCDSEGIFRRIGESNGDLMRWLATTWPWPNEKLPFAFAPFERSSVPADPIMNSSASSSASTSMIMYDSSASLPALLSATGSGGKVMGSGRYVRRTSPCPILRR